MTDTDRAEYIEGLRYLAGMLTDHPDIPLPHCGTGVPMSFYVRDADALRTLAGELTRKTVEKGVTDTYDLVVSGNIHGVWVTLRTTNRLVPQTVTGTRTVDQVEYDYTGLLAERAS